MIAPFSSACSCLPYHFVDLNPDLLCFLQQQTLKWITHFCYLLKGKTLSESYFRLLPRHTPFSTRSPDSETPYPSITSRAPTSETRPTHFYFLNLFFLLTYPLTSSFPLPLDHCLVFLHLPYIWINPLHFSPSKPSNPYPDSYENSLPSKIVLYLYCFLGCITTQFFFNQDRKSHSNIVSLFPSICAHPVQTLLQYSSWKRFRVFWKSPFPVSCQLPLSSPCRTPLISLPLFLTAHQLSHWNASSRGVSYNF